MKHNANKKMENIVKPIVEVVVKTIVNIVVDLFVKMLSKWLWIIVGSCKMSS